MFFRSGLKTSLVMRNSLAIDWNNVADEALEIYRKLRAGRIDKSMIVPLSYFFSIFLFGGLIWFIFYVDSQGRMPVVPPEDPNEEAEMRKFLEDNDLGDDNDHLDMSKLASKRRNDDDAIVYGSTEFYDWSQSSTEMEVFMHSMDTDLRAKDVTVTIKASSIHVTIKEEEKMKGALYADIIPEECSWQVEDDGVTGGRKLWITLFKRKATNQSKMWPCVIQGDGSKSSASKVKTTPGGVPMAEIDLSDENSMKEAIRQAKDAARERQKQA